VFGAFAMLAAVAPLTDNGLQVGRVERFGIIQKARAGRAAGPAVRQGRTKAVAYLRARGHGVAKLSLGGGASHHSWAAFENPQRSQ
jgi:hypothetical protein